MMKLFAFVVLMICSSSSFSQTLNPQGSYQLPAPIFQDGDIVSSMFGEQNSCPENSGGENPCYVIHEIEILEKKVELKTPVIYPRDNWGERFQLIYDLELIKDSAFFEIDEHQTVIQMAPYPLGLQAFSDYQLLISRLDNYLRIKSYGYTTYPYRIDYKIGDADFTSVTTSQVCRVNNVNYQVADVFDLSKFSFDYDHEEDCVYCVEWVAEGDEIYLSDKTKNHLQCREKNKSEGQPFSKQCLQYCETLAEHKSPTDER